MAKEAHATKSLSFNNNHEQPSPPPPPPPPLYSTASFPILAITLLGILTTVVLLVSYYVFVIKCQFSWRRPSNHRRREPFMIYTNAAESRGLTDSAIRAIPTFRFGRADKFEAMKGSFHECAVCLNEFQEDERLRLLPSCCHVFHIDCIDIWLQNNANCPVCRSEITGNSPVPIPTYQNFVQDTNGDIIIEVIERQHQNTVISDSPSQQEQRSNRKKKIARKLSSMGDECIDVRAKDEKFFAVQVPLRRSFSMDSSCNRELYISVQEILQKNRQLQSAAGNINSGNNNNGEGTSNGSTSSRFKRSFFSFGHSRSSRNAVLPINIDL